MSENDISSIFKFSSRKSHVDSANLTHSIVLAPKTPAPKLVSDGKNAIATAPTSAVSDRAKTDPPSQASVTRFPGVAGKRPKLHESSYSRRLFKDSLATAAEEQKKSSFVSNPSAVGSSGGSFLSPSRRQSPHARLAVGLVGAGGSGSGANSV